MHISFSISRSDLDLHQMHPRYSCPLRAKAAPACSIPGQARCPLQHPGCGHRAAPAAWAPSSCQMGLLHSEGSACTPCCCISSSQCTASRTLQAESSTAPLPSFSIHRGCQVSLTLWPKAPVCWMSGDELKVSAEVAPSLSRLHCQGQPTQELRASFSFTE